MLSSCTYFKVMRLGTWGVWNCDFLSLSVAAFFPLVQCGVIWLECVCVSVCLSVLPMRKTHYIVKLVG